MSIEQSNCNGRSRKILPLAVCAVALQSALLVPLASGQNVDPMWFVNANTAAAVPQDGESIMVSAQIRSALWSDQSLSQFAKQVEIVANPQAVILRGPVAPGETHQIEARAREYSGARQIDNQLTVSSASTHQD